ncbi:MAG: histidine kinase dimerization/phospho-acceptor domain-containing protein [Nitrospirota bacterium]
MKEIYEDPISILSHQIKGALTAVKGSIDLLLLDDSFPAEDRRQILTIAKNNTNKIIELINELVAECRK